MGGYLGFFDFLNPENSFKATPVVNSYSATPMGGVNAADQSLGNAQANYGQQGNYINMLQGQAMGQGPSVAQEMLKQQTGQAQQNAASAVASQRGMNPALASRMILNQQAQQGQMAAGQGSLLRAQEMMSARGMLGSALGQQAQSNLGAGHLALGQQGQQLGDYWHAQGLNANVAGQNADLASHAQDVNAMVAAQNAQGHGALLGGLLGGIGAFGPMASSWHGAAGGGSGGASAPTFSQSGAGEGVGDYTAFDNIGVPMSGGGDVSQAVAQLGPLLISLLASKGGSVPGRAEVHGDSPANDQIRALLSPHEIVLPRSVTLADDAPERARDFVRAIKGRMKKKEGFAKGGMACGYAGGGDVEPPLEFPAEDPTHTTANFLAGQGALTPAADVPGATQGAPEMLQAGPPDALASPDPSLAPASFTDTLGGPLGTPQARGPTLDYTPPTEKPFVPGAEMLGGEKEELTGREGEASAKQAQGSAMKESAAQLQKDLAGVTAKYDAQIAAAQNGATAAQAWLNDPTNKVNPDRFWGEKSTGQKITASIGMILGGIGAGLTHGPNVAVDMINKAIDRDIDAQKLNIGVKENLLSRYMQQGIGLEASKEHAKADARDMAAARLDAASAAYMGTAAQAQAQIESGKLRQDAYMHRLQGIAMARQNDMAALQQKFMQHAMSQPGGMAKAMLEMSFWGKPESMAAHTVGIDEDVPTGATDKQGKPVMQTKTTPYLANSPEARTETAKEMRQFRGADLALKDLESFAKKNPLGGTPGTEEVGDAQAAAMHLKMNYEAMMAGMNRQASPEVLAHIDEIVADPTAFFKTSKTGGALKFLRRMLNQHKQDILDTNTLGPQ